MSGPMQWSPGGMVPVAAPETTQARPAIVFGAQAARTFGDDDDDDAEAPALEALAVRRSPPAARRTPPKAKPIAPRDVVRLARARLREVEAELKRLRRLETERDELKRLLDAASGKPRAVVRELPKRSAG